MSPRDPDDWWPERSELFDRDHPDAPDNPRSEDR